MIASTQGQSDRNRNFPIEIRKWLTPLNRAAWRRFFLAILALTLAFYLALYATALGESARYTLSAGIAVISLILAGAVAIKVVPYLARRTAIEHWATRVEYEFTREGILYLVIIAVIAVAALNTGNNLLFIVLSCLLAGMLASGILSRIVLQGLQLDFTLPNHVFAEQAVIAQLRLRNVKRFCASFSITISAQTPSHGKRARALQESEPPVLLQSVYVPYVPSRSLVSERLQLVFPRRGRYFQEGLRVSTKFPFGFIRKAHNVPTPQKVLVLPNPQPTDDFYKVLPFLGNEMEAYLQGHGHDLYAIRDYQETDSVRHIDWKATAREQQLKVREFTREDERCLGLALDHQVPNAQPQTLKRFEKAVTLCACLAWHFSEIGASMRFVTDNFEIPSSPAGMIIYPVLERLALLEPVIGGSSQIGRLLADSSTTGQDFRIVLTCQPRESLSDIPHESSYIVFVD